MDRTPGIRPRPTLLHQLDVASRYGFPTLLTAVGLLLLSAPLGLPGQAQMQPAWALASVFFWSVFRPASMPPVAVFGLGLLLDLLAQGPVGLSVLLLLLVHAVAFGNRRALARQGFLAVWLAFVAVAAGAAALEWAANALFLWRWLTAWPAVFEFGLAAGAYPFLAAAFTRAHRGRAAPERA